MVPSLEGVAEASARVLRNLEPGPGSCSVSVPDLVEMLKYPLGGEDEDAEQFKKSSWAKMDTPATRKSETEKTDTKNDTTSFVRKSGDRSPKGTTKRDILNAKNLAKDLKKTKSDKKDAKEEPAPPPEPAPESPEPVQEEADAANPDADAVRFAVLEVTGSVCARSSFITWA